jgi:NADPH:quinone reductase-like Zn-dependent oxidoreductase
MQAVVMHDGELGIVERPDPVPGDTELLVAVRAAGVNGADLAQRRGAYPPPPGWPDDIPGLELAGEVAATGGRVTRFAVGDKVMALVGGGGQATLATVDETHALPVPDSLSWPAAGGFPEVFSTAFDALFTQGRLTLGERLLVSGASGGVGTAAVQLAAAAGARVVASVRDPTLREAVVDLGAHDVIDPGNVVAHGPYDVVLELVGAPGLEVALSALSTGGRALVVGVGAGARLSLDLFELMGKRAQLRGSTLRSRSLAEKAAVLAAVEAGVLPLLRAGRVRVPVSETFPLGEAERAYERFAARGKLGKIVLIV